MVIIVDSTNPREGVSEIILAQKLDERTILEAMANSIKSGRVTTRDAITGTIADLLLQEDRTKDIGIVLPMTGVIERTMKPINVTTVPPDTLIGLQLAVNDATNTTLQRELALNLGDKALLMHAGQIGSKQMGDTLSTAHYAMSMAYSGYQTAIESYRQRLDTRSAAEPLAIIINQFEKISYLLRKLLRQGLLPDLTSKN